MMGADSALDTVGAKQTFPKVDEPPSCFITRKDGWDGSRPLKELKHGP